MPVAQPVALGLLPSAVSQPPPQALLAPIPRGAFLNAGSLLADRRRARFFPAIPRLQGQAVARARPYAQLSQQWPARFHQGVGRAPWSGQADSQSPPWAHDPQQASPPWPIPSGIRFMVLFFHFSPQGIVASQEPGRIP